MMTEIRGVMIQAPDLELDFRLFSAFFLDPDPFESGIVSL